MNQRSNPTLGSPPQSGSQVHPIDAGGTWMSNGDLHLCLAQLARSSPTEMLADSRRDHSVAALSALLTDPRSLNDYELDGGIRPRIIVAPELSIGSCDWVRIDEILRTSRANTILVIGCGFVKGDWIEKWLQATDGTTARLAGWPSGKQVIAACRPYNVGFAWIKTDASCRCVLFLKNFPDPSAEMPAVPGLALGSWLVRLEAEDLVVFPTICSDLLAHIDGVESPGSAAQRIKRSLEERPSGDKKILITGSLLTPKPGHDIWNRALVHCSEKIGPGHVVALSNAAAEVRQSGRVFSVANAAEDVWRNRTGVFKPTPIPQENVSLPGHLALTVKSSNFTGAVIRETCALIQGGPVRWTSSVVGGKYLWHPTSRIVLSASGTIATIGDVEPLPYEVVRQTMQLQSQLKPPASEGALTDVSAQATHQTQLFRHDAVRELAETLSDPDSPIPGQLANTILSGLDSACADFGDFTSRPDDWQHRSFLLDGLEAVGVVRHAGAKEWRPIPDRENRGMYCDGYQGVVVWSTPFYTLPEMERAISKWIGGAGDACYLVLVGQSKHHHFPSGERLQKLAREDIGQPETTGVERAITEVRSNRRVVLVSLPMLREACESPSPGDTTSVRDRAKAVLKLTDIATGASA